jgi:hypothetical protein
MHNTNKKKLVSLYFICIVAILMSLSTKKGIYYNLNKFIIYLYSIN